jgi:gliding motility-associated-like protein
LYGFPQRDHELTGLIPVNSGGYLMHGYRYYDTYYKDPQTAMLIRIKPEGCVEWARKLTVGDRNTSTIQMVKEAAGGGFYITGDISGKRFIARLDANGNLLWAKTLMTSNGYLLFNMGIEAMPDDGVLLTGYPYGVGKQILMRLNSAGAVVWQKEVVYNQNSGTPVFQNIAFKDNFLYICGNISAGTNNFDGVLTKLDFNTGKTVWTRKYEPAAGFMYLREIISVDSTLLINIGTGTNLPNVPYFGGLMRLDTAGQVLMAESVGETYAPNYLVGPYGAASTHLIRSGKTFYLLSAGSVSLALQPGISYYTKLIKFDSTYKVEWIESSGGAGVPRFYYNAPAPKDGFAIAGDEISALMNPNGLGWYLSLKLIDSAGGNPNANCCFGKQQFVATNIPVTTTLAPWTVDANATVTPSDFSFPVDSFFPEMRFKCPDYVDSCSYLKISGPRSICNLSVDYTFQAHKNKACGQPAQWKVPPGVQIISQNGSAITVRFPAFGRYAIYAFNTLSCTPVQDSIVVFAGNKTPPLNLGPDQQICPQNTTTLHAGPKFLLYEWQDGSTDSTLLVNQPGKYWVKVTDSCSNVLSDTIDITLAPPIPFYVGPNRTKCNNDTIRLEAPAGFMNYNWSPAYNMTATGRVVIVNPQVDTAYMIMAEKTPGCFAYDTVNISVYHSLPVNLGRDTGICMGAQVVLDAGTGFQQYQWSTSAVSRTISVAATGNYSVKCTTPEGCTSGDTIRIEVFDNPVVELGNDNTLCTGSKRVLEAGNFASYEWQNGDTGPSFTVTGLGRYYVTVTDKNKCSGSDTLDVTNLLTAPANFLPADTILCSYATLDVKPIRSFYRYLWSNGATSPVISVRPTGLYWLQATDEHNCTGADSMLIQPKDCLMGLYVPTAFTPNHDGKNDIFKPTLLGNIVKYEFSIYNRWGQRLFYTVEPNKGWDGLNGGKTQDTNVFVWVCKYQLEGEEMKMARGTVTLIR